MSVAQADPMSAVLADPAEWPRAVDFIISALEAGGHTGPDDREHPRSNYRVCALLRLFSDPPDWPGWPIYTREVSVRAVGFLTPMCVPLSHGGFVEIPGPAGRTMKVACTILRCREATPGWYEGAAYFNREQMEFGPEAMAGRE